jgi:crotonobetainyl-CoA:carnitine CoA-transferase CaiB-like acyl-CoA transferase
MSQTSTADTEMAPLADIRVVSVEQFGAGPWATSQLADLGADVIKIEDPSVGGDVARYVPPFNEGASSLFFETFNRGKRSLALDIRHPDGRRAFEDVVRSADAVFSNLRGDQPAKLGLRYEDLSHVNPRIVCASLSGFGTTGPRAPEGAYDLTIQALAGWMTLTGSDPSPPTKSGLSLVDFAAGYVAAIGILAGVWEARRSGVGRDVDLALFDIGLSLLTYMGTWGASRGWEARRMPDSAHQTIVPFQAFPAADGWIVVACAKEAMWGRFCEAIGRPDILKNERFATFRGRDRNRDELIAMLEDVLRTKTVAQWGEILRTARVPSAPVNDLGAALSDPQVEARAAIVGYDHPVLGEVRMIASPFATGNGAGPPRRGPFFGEDADDVLADICGYTDVEIGKLREAGVLGGENPK